MSAVFDHNADTGCTAALLLLPAVPYVDAAGARSGMSCIQCFARWSTPCDWRTAMAKGIGSAPELQRREPLALPARLGHPHMQCSGRAPGERGPQVIENEVLAWCI